MYKSALGDWNKGTGGGSGLETEFEKWDQDKFTKYKISKENYDHSNISTRPLILFDLYSRSKEPFLTVICLWDNAIGNILCSKYDPVKIGSGEVGMLNNDNCSSSLSHSSVGKKRKANALEVSLELKDAIKSIKDVCKDLKSTPKVANTTEKRKDDLKSIEDMDLNELYAASDYLKGQAKFLKDMGILKDDEKHELVEETRKIFAEIRKRLAKPVS